MSSRSDDMVNVRPLTVSDEAEWLRMRLALWPEHSEAGHRRDMTAWRARPDTIVLVAERTNIGTLAGFAEIGTRPYADGCETSPVAFLEGWYVDADLRGHGVGAGLIRAAETWARSQGLRELASDALLDNTASHQAHEQVGFVEVERAVRYRKPL